MEFDKEELAWAAGFFDGEGNTCTIFRSDRATVAITFSVSQNDKVTLYRFQDAICGIGIVRWRNEHISVMGVKTDHYVLEIHNRFEHIQFAMCLLWKKLGIIKREQYKKAVKRYLDSCHKIRWDKQAVYQRNYYKYGVGAKHKMLKEYYDSLPNDINYVFVNPFEKKNDDTNPT